MRLILRLWAWSRRKRRHIFGSDTPHWATDLYKFCKFFNAIELVPTIFAILLAPDHFFRRRHLITLRRSFGVKSVYRSPLGFAGRIVTLLLGLSWLRGLGISELDAAGSFAAVFVTLPILIPAVCLVLILAGLVALLAAKAASMGDEFRGPSLTLQWLWIPVVPSTYRTLQWRSYLWGLFYFYGYLLVVPIVVLTLLGVLSLIGLFIWDFVVEFFNWHPPTALEIRLLTPLYIGGVWVAGRVIVYPYIALLMASARPRSALMLRCRHYNLRGTLKKLASDLGEYTESAAKIPRDPQKWTSRVGKLRSELSKSIAIKLDPQWSALEKAIDVEMARGTPAEDRKAYAREVLKGFCLSEVAQALRTAPVKAASHPVLLSLWSMTHPEPPSVHEVPTFARALQDALVRCRRLERIDLAELQGHYRELLKFSLDDEIPSAFKEWLFAESGEPPHSVIRQYAGDLESACAEQEVDWSRYPATRWILDEVQGRHEEPASHSPMATSRTSAAQT